MFFVTLVSHCSQCESLPCAQGLKAHHILAPKYFKKLFTEHYLNAHQGAGIELSSEEREGKRQGVCPLVDILYPLVRKCVIQPDI